jgi:hypothetical protein
MKFFVLLFLGMFLYGVVVGKLGGALIALFCAGFAYWAHKELCRQDRAYCNSPQSAVTPPDTTELLNEHGCQCSTDKL